MNASDKSLRAPGDPADWKMLFPEPVAVLGYGVEGRSTLAHLLKRGYTNITVLDLKAPAEDLPNGVRGVFGADYLEGLDAKSGIRTAFRAPGVRPFVPEIEAFVARGGTLTSQVEAVFKLLGRDRIIGVTGTVGKGTCCSLLSSMLEDAQIPHRLAGNIGVPPLDAFDEFAALPAQALLLLELSSFQLCTLRESPHLAIVLRTTTEHLDWHATREEYWDHKANLVRYQTSHDVVIFFGNAEGSAWIGGLGSGRRVCVRTASPKTDADALTSGALRTAAAAETTADDTVLLTFADAAWASRGLRLALADTNMTGAFNLENIASAAAAALELGAPLTAIQSGARRFIPLEHRIEFVREHAGIRYFNDSYATRPEAALAAVRAFRSMPGSTQETQPEPLGLILGGSEKHADFTELAAALAQEPQLRAIAFIGQTAERMERDLQAAGALNSRKAQRCETLEEAVMMLRSTIREGVILLSPACASFGLFANYKERGKAFKTLVRAL